MDMLVHDSNNNTEELLCVLRNDTGKRKAVLVLKFCVTLAKNYLCITQ